MLTLAMLLTPETEHPSLLIPVRNRPFNSYIIEKIFRVLLHEIKVFSEYETFSTFLNSSYPHTNIVRTKIMMTRLFVHISYTV